MKKNKKLVINLRKQGYSYNQISNKLDIAKSTLSYWLKDIKISKEAQSKINSRVYKKSILALIKRNKQQTALAKDRADKIRLSARKEVNSLIHNKLFLTGISLYWAEGYKKGAYGSKWKSVDFANSDPKMILLMMRFFREICKISDKKINIQILAHVNIDLDKSLRFWSKLTRIPKDQFIRTNYSVNLNSKGIRNKNTLPYGTIHVRINDVKEFFRIIGWVEGLQDYFKV